MVRRRGFPIVPDFGTTVHKVTGRTLESEKLDLEDFQTKASHEKMMMGFMRISRVQKADDLMIVQAFPPLLFNLGPQPGPTLLLQFLRGEVKETELEDRWAQIEEDKRNRKTLWKDALWTCSQCKVPKGVQEYNRIALNDRSLLHNFFRDAVIPGAWRMCLACRTDCRDNYWCKICGKQMPRDNFDIDALRQLESKN